MEWQWKPLDQRERRKGGTVKREERESERTWGISHLGKRERQVKQVEEKTIKGRERTRKQRMSKAKGWAFRCQSSTDHFLQIGHEEGQVGVFRNCNEEITGDLYCKRRLFWNYRPIFGLNMKPSILPGTCTWIFKYPWPYLCFCSSSSIRTLSRTLTGGMRAHKFIPAWIVSLSSKRCTSKRTVTGSECQ